MVATEERVLTLLAEANPIPDVDSLDLEDISGTRYLATLDQRSSEMTKTDHGPEVKTRPGRPLMPVLAAAVVLVAGTLTFLGINRGPTDIASSGVAVAEGFAEAVSSGATDLSAHVSDEATFGPMTVPLDDDLAAFWAGLNTTLSVSNCEQTAQVVRCSYEWADRIREVQERPEFGTLTFLIDGTRVASISRDWDPGASRWLEAGDPVIDYLEWLNRTHPGWELELDWVTEPISIGGGYAPLAHDDPVHNARYAEVLVRHLDEYAEHLATDELPG